MMRIRNILIGSILITTFSSCIEFFHPDLGCADTSKYVVDGQVTDKEGYQEVTVSLTSSLDKSKFNPLSFCNVTILDDKGNVFNLKEYNNGKYRVWMNKEYLKLGYSYQVKVETKNGVEIISDFDKMPECPEIDTVYYILKDVPTSNPYNKIQGIQFYVDIDGENTNSHYFRWILTETWEHHAPSSGSICWTTEELKNIYTITTEALTQNRYNNYNLHFVNNLTQRLNFCYSLLINQYAISEPTYRYLNKLKFNSNDQGGLYNTQPLSVKGNLKSTTNPDLEILGFFSATSVKSKRIFVRHVTGLKPLEIICIPDILPGGVIVIGPACIECDYWDGTRIKPDYWPY